MDRRSALKSILGGVGAVAVAPGVVAEGLEQVVTVEEVKPTFEDFMAGRVDETEYLENLAEEVPLYNKLKEKGIARGIFYNPGVDEAEDALRDVYNNPLRGENPDNFDKLLGMALAYDMTRLKEAMISDKGAAFIFPVPMNPRGDRWGRYIAVKEGIKKMARCDEDLKSLIYHECIHALDSANGDKLVADDYGVEPEISPGFYHAYTEMKANYVQLIEAFKKTPGEEGAVSKLFFANTLANYYNYSVDMKKEAKTPHDKMVLDAVMRTPKEITLYSPDENNVIMLGHKDGRCYGLNVDFLKK